MAPILSTLRKRTARVQNVRMHDSHSSPSSAEAPIGNESFLIGSGKSTPSGSSDDEQQPALWHLAGAISMINLSIFLAWLYHNTSSPFPFVAGLLVGVLLAFALSGRPVAAVLRRLTGWQQSLCYPFGIVLGNLLGFAAGGVLALCLA